MSDFAALTAGQPLLGRTLAADADVGGTVADVDPLGRGDKLHPYAVIDRPDLADMGGNEGRRPWPGRDADNAVGQVSLAPAGQRLHCCLDVFGAPQQFFADRGQPVAGLLAHEQRFADLLFQRGDASSKGGCAEARGSRRCAQATQPRNVEKQPQIVPADIHFAEMKNSLRPWL
ncbi:hypothetical protein NKJ13_29355 [Mesorhizobium sp. M0174]